MGSEVTINTAGNQVADRDVHVLEVRDLHAYYGKSHILQGVSLRVGEGDYDNVLQELDRRIRQLTQPKQADEAMARLYRVMFDQAGPE